MPWVGLNPTSPQHAAGMRIDPAPSEAVAMPTAPAAISAAEPPEDPPVVCPRLSGLRVIPCAVGLGEAEDRELGQRRLGDDDHPGRANRGDEVGVLGSRHEHRLAAQAGDLARDVEIVLDRDRDAEQRPALPRGSAAVRLVGSGKRLVGEHRDGRVDRRVLAIDGVERRLGELPRGQRPGGEQLALSRWSSGHGLGGCHGESVVNINNLYIKNLDELPWCVWKTMSID